MRPYCNVLPSLSVWKHYAETLPWTLLMCAISRWADTFWLPRLLWIMRCMRYLSFFTPQPWIFTPFLCAGGCNDTTAPGICCSSKASYFWFLDRAELGIHLWQLQLDWKYSNQPCDRITQPLVALWCLCQYWFHPSGYPHWTRASSHLILQSTLAFPPQVSASPSGVWRTRSAFGGRNSRVRMHSAWISA